MPQQVFTTGDISKLLNVSAKTVAGWIDSRKLGGVRIPGSGKGDRRVWRRPLIAFLKENGFPPLDELEGSRE